MDSEIPGGLREQLGWDWFQLKVEFENVRDGESTVLALHIVLGSDR